MFQDLLTQYSIYIACCMALRGVVFQQTQLLMLTNCLPHVQGPTNYLRDPWSTWERLTLSNTFCESRALSVPRQDKEELKLPERGSKRKDG